VTKLRAAGPEDAAPIAELNVRSWQVSYRGVFPDEFLDEMKTREPQVRWLTEVLAEGSSFRTTVAVESSVVVGFAILGPVRDSDLDASTVQELYSLYVEPDRVGTGLGRLLMDDALSYLRSGPWTAATLWTLRDVPQTTRFYEAAGWSHDGTDKTEEIPEGNPVVQVRYRIDLRS
jgi:GNAT superfamily N-acetyltransferase